MTDEPNRPDIRALIEKAVDTHLDTFFLFEPATRKAVSWNDAFRRISGYTDDEIAELPAPDSYYSPEDLEVAQDFVQRIIREGAGTIELELICKDGRKVPTEYQVTVLRDDDGAPKYLVSIGRDITDRKALEQRERETRKRLQLAMESANEGIWQWDFSTGLVTFDEVALGMLGYAPDFPPRLGEWWIDQIHPDDRSGVAKSFADFVAGREKAYNVAFRLKRIDGDFIWVNSTARILRTDPAGNPLLVLGIHRDITEQKRAEDALRESELRFQYAIEATSDGLFDWNIRTNEIYYSPTYFTMLGYEPDELPHTFDTYVQLLHPEDAKRSERALADHLESGRGEAKSQMRFKHKSGKWIWVLSRGRIVEFDEHGNPFRFVGTNTNIDDLVRTRQALEHEKRNAQQYLNVTDIMLIALDVKGNVTLINPAGCRVLGRTEDEIVGKNWFDHFLHTQDVDEVKSVFNQIIAGNIQPVEYYENPIVTKDGEKRMIAWHNSILRDDSGEVTRLFSSGEDITERKIAEAESQKQTELLKAIFDNMPVMITYYNPRLRVLTVNKAFESTIGWTNEDLKTVDLMEKVYPDPAIRKEAAAFMQEAPDTWREFVVTTKSGQKLDTNWINITLTDDTTVGIGLDLSEAKRAEREQLRLEEQLHQSQKIESIGRLAGGIAHDFNNLLTAIQGFSELVADSLQDGDPLKDDVSEIQNAADSAAALTRQLLAFSRKQIIEPRVLDLNAALGKSERILRRIIEEDIDIAFRLDDHECHVFLDPGQIDQILINLGVNARDAMSNGGNLTLETHHVSLDDEECQTCGEPIIGEYVMLAISDDGIGMDDETMSKIFEPFFTTKEKETGTGLGLSTIHGIVHQNQGHINVYSEPGMGTTFKIYLPTAKAAPSTPKTTQESTEIRGDETIMVVEDKANVRKLAVRSLRAQGYHIIEAQNGGEAFLKFEEVQGKIDLLLTDVVMPQMSGKQLYDRLKKINPELAVIYTSGYTENTIAHRGVLNKGVHFVQKPFRPYDLAKKVRQVLEAGKPR